MIYIFHGDDQYASRSAFNQQIDQQSGKDIFRLDSKSINLDLVNNFLNSQSLFVSQKILVLTNLFSTPKAILDKIINLIKDDSHNDIYIWQDKTLTPTQTKIFPQAKINHFPVNKVLFSCLNQIRPKNISKFIPLYQKVTEQEPFELFLFFVKNNLRKQITNYQYSLSVHSKCNRLGRRKRHHFSLDIVIARRIFVSHFHDWHGLRG